uniref:Dipeptidase n=1 Tax=Culicoides sonorensis TaxID=179676 RepID=A0A336LBM1_CULSO
MNSVPNHEFLEMKENYLHQAHCKQQCFVFTDISELDLPEMTKFPIEKMKNGSVHSLHSFQSSKKCETPIPPERKSKTRKIIAIFGILLLLLVVIAIIPLTLQLRTSSLLEARLAFIRRLLNEAPLVEGYWNPNMDGNFSQSFDEVKENMVGAILWPIKVPCGAQHLDAVQLALEGIDYARRTVSNNFGMRIVETADEMDVAHADGMVSVLLGLEGHSLGSSLGVLRSFYSLGARFASLTALSCTTPWAGSAITNSDVFVESDAPTSLTEFGETMLHEMNRLGMVAEISRLSEPAMMVALNSAKAPLLLSNASPQALCNATASIPDHIMSAMSQNGGIMMLNVEKCGDKLLTVKDAIQMINYVRAIAGIDHVGLSSAPKIYPMLLAELARDRLWGNVAIKKLVGGNIVRVLRDVDSAKQKISLREDWIPNEEIELTSYCRYPEM